MVCAPLITRFRNTENLVNPLFRVPPDVGLAASTAGGPSTPPSAKRTKGGGGEEGGRGRRGKGFGLREGSSNRNGGSGGDPPNTSWGQTHIWGSQLFLDMDVVQTLKKKNVNKRPKQPCGKSVCNGESVNVARLQTKVWHDICVLSYELLTKNAPELSLKLMKPLFCGSQKIP